MSMAGSVGLALEVAGAQKFHAMGVSLDKATLRNRRCGGQPPTAFFALSAFGT